MIAGYDEHEHNLISELTLDELFTLEEARALVQYLDTRYGEQGIQSMMTGAIARRSQRD